MMKHVETCLVQLNEIILLECHEMCLQNRLNAHKPNINFLKLVFIDLVIQNINILHNLYIICSDSCKINLRVTFLFDMYNIKITCKYGTVENQFIINTITPTLLDGLERNHCKMFYYSSLIKPYFTYNINC